MDIASKLTVSQLTPPGYFNLAEDAPVFHRNYIAWWNALLARRASQAKALRTAILTPWLVDYNDYPRTAWLNYLLDWYGLSYFGGTNSQAAALYKLVSNAWQRSTITNVLLTVQTLCLAPFSWFEITSSPSIIIGNLIPATMDTGFIIYSTAVSAPATPSATPYVARAWGVPANWTRVAASATYYSRGYLSGATIVWCAPRGVSDFANAYTFSSTVPLAVPTAGTICIVNADGTGDTAAVYYSDGSVWRKNSVPNADLGLVVAGVELRPIPEAITVFAPDPATVVYAVNSATPPPANGATKGYGTFSGFSETTYSPGQEFMTLHQIAGGTIAIATLLDLLRRIKPVGQQFVIKIDNTLYTISDSRQV